MWLFCLKGVCGFKENGEVLSLLRLHGKMWMRIKMDVDGFESEPGRSIFKVDREGEG